MLDQQQSERATESGAGSLEAIYSEYFPRVHRYLVRLLGPDEAEDVAQEVFLKLGRSLGEFRGESSLLTWIFRIATNAATDRIRTPAHRARLASTPLDESCDSGSDAVTVSIRTASAEEHAIRSEMSGCVQGLLGQLPENYRTPLILSEMEGLKNAEIAEILGLSLDTVKIRLHRARARLKKSLDEKCSFYRDPRNTLLCDIKRQPG